MKFRTAFAALALATTSALITAPVIAEKATAPAPAIYTAEDNNIALSGFDTVSYFTGDPVKGSAEFSADYKGATFQFASAENLATFKLDPAKYAPAYGGHCAWGAAQGSAFPGDPAVYAIVDGKLYLNYNTEVQEGWDKDRAGFITKADAAWPAIIGETAPAAGHGS